MPESAWLTSPVISSAVPAGKEVTFAAGVDEPAVEGGAPIAMSRICGKAGARACRASAGSVPTPTMVSLRLREGGEWTVSAYDQLGFDWVDYDLGFSDWLYSALSPDQGFDILPPFGNERPLGSVSLDVENMFKGSAG